MGLIAAAVIAVFGGAAVVAVIGNVVQGVMQKRCELRKKLNKYL